MVASITPVIAQLKLNTNLFNNVLKGVDDSLACKQIAGQVNHLTWIAGHLVNNRYFLASQLGIVKEFEYKDTFTDFTAPPPFNRALSASVEYPAISTLSAKWAEISPLLVDAVAGVTEEKMAEPFFIQLPTGNTMEALFSFFTSHEAYHVGQMSTIRRYLGLGPMDFV